MKNRDIVEIVCRTYNVPKMVQKLISSTYLDKMNLDLSSHILIILMNEPNDKLNKLFMNDELKQYINRIILNNRNYYRSYLNLMRNKNIELTELNNIDLKEEIESYEEREERENRNLKRYNKIIDILSNDTFSITGLTTEEMKLCLSLEIYKDWIGVDVIDSNVVFKKRLSMTEITGIYKKTFKNGKVRRLEVRQVKSMIEYAVKHIKSNVGE